MPWKIIDHGPQIWQLYQNEQEELFLSVRCERGFMGFTTLLQLSPEECLEFKVLGHVAVDYLGQKVSYWAFNYQDRNVFEQFQKQERVAIDEWLAAHPGQYL